MGLISILRINSISKIAENIAIGIILFTFILGFANIFRKEPLNGLLDGTIVFNPESLVINNLRIELQEINKIFLRINDYEGKNQTIIRISLFPRISNGTDNLLDLELKNGKKIKLFFQIKFENQVEELQPFVISLIKNEIINFEKGIEWLQIDDENEIKKIEKLLNKKEL